MLNEKEHFHRAAENTLFLLTLYICRGRKACAKSIGSLINYKYSNIYLGHIIKIQKACIIDLSDLFRCHTGFYAF